MHIIHIASEIAPIAKVGGLGDVLIGLSRAEAAKGHKVEVIIPKYDCIHMEGVRDLKIEFTDLKSLYEGIAFQNTIWSGFVEEIKVYFIDSCHPREFFNRNCFYGCHDDIERFLYFSRAALDFLFKTNKQPDIIHLHDWQSAAIAPLYYEIFKPLGYLKPKIIFTIHNIEYQGKCEGYDLDKIGLNSKCLLNSTQLQDNYHPSLVNLLKGAIVYSDFITTVSPNYAKEVKTTEGGRGLEGTLTKYANKFIGILNGIDYDYWNPATDRYLPEHYANRDIPIENAIKKKSKIKKVLKKHLLLNDSNKPIVGCIARLVPQKGIELIKHSLKYTLENQGQFVLLGSSPIPSIEADFHALQKEYANNSNVHLFLRHEEETAHLIFSGSDMFIVPSLFEPCGLTQMIALRYGTIPIVRKTGGLADTIFDVDYSGKKFDQTNGYSFDFPDATGVESALSRAFSCWFNEQEKWKKLIINGMKIDFSWNLPADRYIQIYKKVIGPSL